METYTGNIKWSGNHYDAGQMVTGSKIKQEDGRVFIFDDELINYGFTEIARDEWAEVAQHTAKLNGEPVTFDVTDTSELPNMPFCAAAKNYHLCPACLKTLVYSETYEPIYCCSGLSEGCYCMGMPIDPLFCTHCEKKLFDK